MKAVILAGGRGTRLSEETGVRPKPMVEIGGMPILWHIMKLYAHHGVTDFIVCCGYKGYMIKEYFANYLLHAADVTFDLRLSETIIHERRAEPWRITLVDTGDDAMTGGRLLRVADYLRGEDAFCLTYGDGLSDLNISESIAFHRQHGRLATVGAVLPPGRFGALEVHGGVVAAFREKPQGDGALINGGFFVLSPQVLSYLQDSQTVWEQEPLGRLASENNLMAFEHRGFWQPMDTLRDRQYLEALWSSNQAPWKVWT